MKVCFKKWKKILFCSGLTTTR